MLIKKDISKLKAVPTDWNKFNFHVDKLDLTKLKADRSIKNSSKTNKKTN